MCLNEFETEQALTGMNWAIDALELFVGCRDVVARRSDPDWPSSRFPAPRQPRSSVVGMTTDEPDSTTADRADRHRDRFGRLLLVLVITFLLTGLNGAQWMEVVVAAAQLAAIIVAVSTVGLPSRLPRRPTIVALVVTAGAAVILAGIDSGTASGWGFVCLAFVSAGLLVVVLNRILNHHDVQLQTIAGAMCAYLLLGSFFGSIFGALNVFSQGDVFNHPMAAPDYGYFSMATLTTVGYGDYVAVGEFARRLAMVEAITGQMFLATAVARLMSVARVPQRRPRPAVD